LLAGSVRTLNRRHWAQSAVRLIAAAKRATLGTVHGRISIESSDASITPCL
jgi:hypothetical protein